MRNLRLTNSFRAARRSAWLFIAAILAGSAFPALLFGHAVVYPKKSTPGAYERYVLRVPSEKEAATTRVEIRFPSGLRVTSFEDVPGWRLEVLTDSAKHIIGAVWTGTLAPQRFAEFPFMAANPKTNAELLWPVYQTYADGQRVEWTGAKGSKTPASATSIAAIDSTVATPGIPSRNSWIAWAALVLAVISLGIALRPRESLP
jgi:uncharacterized protein YcnI